MSKRFFGLYRRLSVLICRVGDAKCRKQRGLWRERLFVPAIIKQCPAVSERCIHYGVAARTKVPRRVIRGVIVAAATTTTVFQLLPAGPRLRQVVFQSPLSSDPQSYFLREGSVELTRLEAALETLGNRPLGAQPLGYYASTWEAELTAHYAKKISVPSSTNGNPVQRVDSSARFTTKRNNVAGTRVQTEQNGGTPGAMAGAGVAQGESATEADKQSAVHPLDPPSVFAELTGSPLQVTQTNYDTNSLVHPHIHLPPIEKASFVEDEAGSPWSTEALAAWEEYWTARHATAIAKAAEFQPSPSDRIDLRSQLSIQPWSRAPRPPWQIAFMLGIAFVSYRAGQQLPSGKARRAEPAKIPLYTTNRVIVPQAWILTGLHSANRPLLNFPRTIVAACRSYWVEVIAVIMMVVWIVS